MRDTCDTFEVLLDPDRVIYRSYQLESSRWRAWSPKTLWTYVKLLAAGRTWLPKEGDISQMSGDFIIDSKGIIRLAYRSKEPTDRPSVEYLLKIINDLNENL